MAKVGIVTQPLLGNYGGILQNYALQTVLRRLGHEPVTIDYISPTKWYRYLLSTLKTIVLYPFPSRRRNFVKWEWCPVRENILIDKFINEHISKTGYVYRYNSKLISKLGISAVIVGSDQIWRPKYNPDLKDLYLDFLKKKKITKIAYAASFGTSELEYTPKNIRTCSEAAKQLDAVSVREMSGINLCRDYFGIDAVEVLDPTLLLTADDYCELAADRHRSKDSYLGVYILDRKPETDSLLKEIKRLSGLTNIRLITENDKDSAPQDWIAMIRDAGFVVTDSFHATVFSIIFRKDFITLCNRDRGADRFTSLLNPLGLMDRLVDRDCKELKIIAAQKIDWEKVSDQLGEQREHSINFLKNNLPKSLL